MARVCGTQVSAQRSIGRQASSMYNAQRAFSQTVAHRGKIRNVTARSVSSGSGYKRLDVQAVRLPYHGLIQHARWLSHRIADQSSILYYR